MKAKITEDRSNPQRARVGWLALRRLQLADYFKRRRRFFMRDPVTGDEAGKIVTTDEEHRKIDSATRNEDGR